MITLKPVRPFDIIQITEIREYFEDHDQVLNHDFDRLRESKDQPKVWDLIYGVSRDQDLSALIACLPERSQVDRLVANYFEMASFFRREHIKQL